MISRNAKGFTLIELIIVLTIIGILVGLALPNYQNAVKKSRETVLKETLFQLRKLIDQYFTDKAKYPASLQALVDENYLRKVPIDTVTGKYDSWIEVREQPKPEEIEPGSQFGILDIKSGAEGNGLDGTPYSSW